MRDHRTWTLIGVALVVFGAGPVARASDIARKPPEVSKASRDARAVAAKVDRLLAEKWAEAKVVPVGQADDAEYLRRLSLDLVGKIPTASEARDFLDDPTPDKRAKLVERLLEGPASVARAIDLYRQLLRPEGQARSASPAFEAWLREKVVEEAGYDEVAREILTAGLGARTAASSIRGEPLPAASIVKEKKPEDLDAGASRVFLGVRLECAQCHDDPFAGWKREEFWGLAAYFAGVQELGPRDGRRSIREVANRRDLAIPGIDKCVRAGPLGGTPPAWKAKAEPQEARADWITPPGNLRFTKAAVNRVWARFLGTGIDEVGGVDVPSGPELLDLLAVEFAAHDFDLKFPIRAITATRAYGLAGALDRPGPIPAYLFSARSARRLSAGQLRSSLEQATGSRVDADSVLMDACTAPGRSIDRVAGATWIESCDTIAAVSEAPYLDTAGRIEELYLAALTRRPRAEESASFVGSVEKARTPEGRSKALADVFRALLDGPEFKQYH